MTPCNIVARHAATPKTFFELVNEMMLRIPASPRLVELVGARRYAASLVRAALNTLKQDGRVIRVGRRITVA